MTQLAMNLRRTLRRARLRRRGTPSRSTATTYGLPLVGIGLFLGLWQLGASVYPAFILPSPFATTQALYQLVLEGTAIQAAVATTLHAFGGFGLALLIGLTLGGIAGFVVPLQRIVEPIVTIFQGIPPIAWIVLTLLWFGNSGTTVVFTVAVATVPLVFISTVAGVREVDRDLREMVRVFEAPNWVRVADLYVPHLVPHVFPIVITGLGFAWKITVMSELLAASNGIGAGLQLARINLNTAEALAWILLTVALIFAFQYLVLYPLQRWLEPWKRDVPGAPEDGDSSTAHAPWPAQGGRKTC